MAMPIPERPEGYLFKASPNATVRIDVFEDLLCSACREFDPIFKTFLKTYQHEGAPITDFVEVYTHVFPLPYHHNAFFVSRLAPYIYDKTGCGGAVNEFASWTFENQDEWLSGGASNLTEPEILESICTEFSGEFSEYGFAKSECLSAIKDIKYEMRTRTSWKYATSLGVNGTPTVFVNGVELTNAPFSEQDWESFVQQYLPK